MVLREVFERLDVVKSDGMSKVLVNDILCDVFKVIGVKQHLVKSIILAVLFIKNVDEAVLLNILHL
jgi:hypothetical protein